MLNLVILSFSLFSTPNYFKNYYPYISQAEICIMQQQYDKAMQYYKKGFQKVKYQNIPYKDCHNYTICAFLQNDTLEGFRYLEKLVSMGSTPHLLSQHPVFGLYLNTSHWQKLTQKTDSLLQIHQKIFRQEDYQYLDSLSYQNMHSTCMNPKAQKDTPDHMDRFREFIKEKGFLNDYEIKKGLSPRPDYNLLKFNYSFEWINLLKEAAKKGKISPYVYAKQYDFFYHSLDHLDIQRMPPNIIRKNTYYASFIIEPDHFFSFVTEGNGNLMSSTNTKNINKNRKALGIITFKEAQKMVVFKKENAKNLQFLLY
ncbi:MAG: hypothetical protein EAZ55_04050 [Cytophagales bacterium]|nr:MAG: hypothetical protein EAZ55_04050 [Cytophagales bacterium]